MKHKEPIIYRLGDWMTDPRLSMGRSLLRILLVFICLFAMILSIVLLIQCLLAN